ncbi:MAG: acyltransferase family protein, partial [Agathobacter sp.]|nr:acyltransferase family protein [Agathobacter sp.]
MTQEKRDHSLDNLKAILIFLVVFAHLLEDAAVFDGKVLLYKMIYSFHMPVFIFILGYFAKFRPMKILLHWVVPYLVLQMVYILFANYVLGE